MIAEAAYPPSDFWRAPGTPRTLPTERFVPLLTAALEIAPERIALRARLARILYLNDRIEAVEALLAEPFEKGLLMAEEAHVLGMAADASGHDDLAYRALRTAVEGGARRSHGYLGELLFRRGEVDAAVKVCLEGLAADPLDFKPLGIAARAMLDRGEEARLWELCLDLRARGAWSNYLPSAMMLSASTAEQRAVVAGWLDEDRFFQVTRLDLPPGFNDALADELVNHPGLTLLPRTKATAGLGQRVNQLNLVGGPMAQSLLSRIRSEVERYCAERRGLTHPVVANTPGRVRLNGWALIVRQDGHENWHIHPDGWLSGVYYVKTPNLNRFEGDNAGDIEFGLNAFALAEPRLPLPNRTVRPEPGLLLLFPSFHAHRTWPTEVEEARICIAFDIIPIEGDDGESAVGSKSEKPPGVGLRDRIARHPSAVIAGGGGAPLLANINSLSVLQLDRAGEEIWRRLDHSGTLEGLIGGLARDYDAPRDVIESQTRIFVESLLAHDLVTTSVSG